MSIVDAIGTTMDKLADKVGTALFHEQGRPIPVLRFAVGRNAALDWSERQDLETLRGLETFIRERTSGAQADGDDARLTGLILVADRLRQLGYPDQAQYFADLNGARGWVDGFLSYVEVARARRKGL